MSNTGDSNTGYFNVDKPKVRIFGKETNIERENIIFPDWLYFDLTEWIDEKDMTKEEKQENPSYKTTKGYLKLCGYKEAFINSFNSEKDLKEIQKLLDLPNFDYNIFEKISGISKQMIDSKFNNQDK